MHIEYTKDDLEKALIEYLGADLLNALEGDKVRACNMACERIVKAQISHKLKATKIISSAMADLYEKGYFDFKETPSVEFKKIPSYGDLFKLKSWKDAVACGLFIDDDGDGRLATENQVSDIIIMPSDLKDWQDFPLWCTHILWFNK